MIRVRPMRESDLAAADITFRTAFGTFLGMPDPAAFAADRDYVYSRFRANPEGAFSAEMNGEFAGSNFLAHWGTFGFFGPLTVRPDLWSKGVAQALLNATTCQFSQWKARDAALFTFVQSPKHLALYQKFNFWPGFLIGLMSKDVQPSTAHFKLGNPGTELTNSIYEGLDLTLEINSPVANTVMTDDGSFAICHIGEGTEAGAGNCYIKFAAARTSLIPLLEAVASFAHSRGMKRIEAGVNFECLTAYKQMLDHGYKVERQALAMHRNGSRGYTKPEALVLGDWR